MRFAPRQLLLWLFGLVALPLAAIGGLNPAIEPIAIAVLALLAVLAIVDGALAARSASGIRVEVSPLVRLTKEREGTLPLVFVRAESAPAVDVRVGLAFPPEIKALPDAADVSLAAAMPVVRWDWPVIPRRRGRYFLDRVVLETASPLGLWSRREGFPIALELRVYPDLRIERRQIAAMFLPRGGQGVRKRRQVGKGREFEKLREYTAGDPPEEIHWKATARRRKPITRVYQIERTQEVYVILDTSRLSARLAPLTAGPAAKSAATIRTHAALDDADLVAVESAPPTTLERTIASAMLLGDVAARQGDFFGLVTFADRVENFLRARGGIGQHQAVREALFAVQPRMVSPDFGELCAFLRVTLRKRALLVVLTALDDPVLAEAFVRNISLLSRQHLVIVPMVRPAEAQPLFSEDMALSRVDNAAALYARLGGHLRWRHLHQTGESLRSIGVHFSLLDQERMTAQLVNRYLEVKARQLI
jgi:uncharacterized protein (DUF58 family)